MTREQASKLAPVMQHYANGKDVEYFDPIAEKWLDYAEPDFNPTDAYRIKPQKTYRSWTFDTAPFPCVLRSKWSIDKFIPISIGKQGYYHHNGCLTLDIITFTEALKSFEHSIDNCKTWLPCGISN